MATTDQIKQNILAALDAANYPSAPGGPAALVDLVDAIASQIQFYAGSDAVGTSTFVGSGAEQTIPHGLGQVPSYCAVVPQANPGGYLGEIWVRWDATNIYVGNTGTFTGGFAWVARR